MKKKERNCFLLSDFTKMYIYFGQVLQFNGSEYRLSPSRFFYWEYRFVCILSRNMVRVTATACQQNDTLYFEPGWSTCLQWWHITRKARSFSIPFILGGFERWIQERWRSAPSIGDNIFQTFFASWMCRKLKGADSLLQNHVKRLTELYHHYTYTTSHSFGPTF